MPNHVRTVIKISKIKSKEDVDFIVNMIASPIESGSDDTDKSHYILDFDKIIPEPKTKEECPKEYLVKKTSAIVLRDEKPWFDWYEWHIDNWGTKWGAYDGYTIIGKSYIKFVFSTAWSVAHPIIDRLALLGYPLDVQYADEDWGSNCGMITWSSEQGWNIYPEEEIAHPERFARNLWNKY